MVAAEKFSSAFSKSMTASMALLAEAVKLKVLVPTNPVSQTRFSSSEDLSIQRIHNILLLQEQIASIRASPGFTEEDETAADRIETIEGLLDLCYDNLPKKPARRRNV